MIDSACPSIELSRSRQALPAASLRLSEVVSALSFALDITEGQPMGHATRSCVIGMRIGMLIGLTPKEQSSLFYALLLKDLGCSSNAARLCTLFEADDRALKHVYKLTDWTDLRASAGYVFHHAMPGASALSRALRTLRLGTNADAINRGMVTTRCERGAEIVRRIGLDDGTVDAIRALDEHWGGSGMPYGLRGAQIPILARICGLAQTMEVFLAAEGPAGAFAMLRRRSGTWFDPQLVRALLSIESDAVFWTHDVPMATLDEISALEPRDGLLGADEERLDQIAVAFAMVIDAKSPFTARHSEGVAAIAEAIGVDLGLDDDVRRSLRRAALLHDIGKLGVSNLILDKPGKLTPEEFDEVKKHPAFTGEILRRVTAFSDIAGIASQHHERLDGRGYHSGLTGEDLGLLARILAVSDVAEALSADRPYRAGLSLAEVREILARQSGTGLCSAVVESFAGLAELPRPTGAPLTCDLMPGVAAA